MKLYPIQCILVFCSIRLKLSSDFVKDIHFLVSVH
ncbi:unnamed protein product [Schistosoma curassoni]|uniref:Uncharacterized protein n=1 Tax=Schistosoma curassoni TaxID=6186 RepID=A0A183JCY6_9TREM|nr:unnamed protein product [Schistosoma curassoni]